MVERSREHIERYARRTQTRRRNRVIKKIEAHLTPICRSLVKTCYAIMDDKQYSGDKPALLGTALQSADADSSPCQDITNIFALFADHTGLMRPRVVSQRFGGIEIGFNCKSVNALFKTLFAKRSNVKVSVRISSHLCEDGLPYLDLHISNIEKFDTAELEVAESKLKEHLSEASTWAILHAW